MQTRAALDGDEWVINGQKVWTSLAHVSRTGASWSRAPSPASARHKGLSFLLVPMDQPGVEVRPIVQITGGGEFNEVFFDRRPHGGRPRRRRAGRRLAGRDGPARLRARRLDARPAGRLRARARRTSSTSPAAAGSRGDPVVRQRLADACIGLQLMRWNALRSMARSGVPGPEATISKLFWGTWHRDLGELMIDLLGRRRA